MDLPETKNEKLLKLESITDKVLALMIQFPAPMTSFMVIGALLGVFLSGVFVGHIL